MTHNTAHARCPGSPIGSKGDTDRGGVATNGVVHTLQTREDKGPTMPAEVMCTEIWSCACGEGMRARAG